MFSGEPMNPAFTLTGLWLRLDRTRAACRYAGSNKRDTKNTFEQALRLRATVSINTP